MSTAVSNRLDPAIFRLPVDRIRDGYYSDAYFVLTKNLLEAEGEHPHVTMQVFQKEDSILGGIDEAIAVLKTCSGHSLDGEWVNGWDQLVVHALREGDRIAPRETVMTIEGDYSLFAHLETVYLGSLARRSLIMRNVAEVVRGRARQADLLLPGPPRSLAGADRRRLERARRRRDRRLHRRPGLVVGRSRDRHRAARADRRLRGRHREGGGQVRRALPRRHEHHRAGRFRQRLGHDRPGGRRGARAKLWGVRLDTSEQLVDRSLLDEMGGFSPTGVNPRLVEKVRGALDGAGFSEVKIVASGGFTADRIREFEAKGIAVDAYGVGSSLIRGQDDFTADVVLLDGRPCAKVGRAYSPNPRLERVQ